MLDQKLEQFDKLHTTDNSNDAVEVAPKKTKLNRVSSSSSRKRHAPSSEDNQLDHKKMPRTIGSLCKRSHQEDVEEPNAMKRKMEKNHRSPEDNITTTQFLPEFITGSPEVGVGL